MSRIVSRISRDAAFAENEAHNRRLLAELRGDLERVALGGPERARERHRARGRLLVRERIERLLDPGAPFLELMALASEGCHADDTPAGGLVTGIGSVHGEQVMVLASDVTMKGGTLYPITVQK